MSILRPRTGAAIRQWPEVPVVYRRPFLRAFMALWLVAFAAWDVSMVWWPPQDDPLLATDWWLSPVMFVVCIFLPALPCASRQLT